jgi:2',3'-cyclic-nucleotide 2'-phosphodiesterase/3'-nucleotidase
MKDGKVIYKQVSGQLVSIADMAVDEDYMAYFQADIDSVNHFVNRKIGVFQKPVYVRDSYFGNSAFCDLIHNLQLQITGADISLNAPLTFDTVIPEGEVCVADMFNLYKYENQIYVMLLTGEEVRRHLEMSYDLWVNTMKSPDDHIMLLADDNGDDNQRFMFKNLAFNFDSAAGIDYEVDVTKPDGEKVHILSMSDGQPFDPQKTYRVSMNSYRGNGGGELLTRGAGIPQKELNSRIVWRSERDQRYYLMQEIEKAGKINPLPNHNWRFVPEAWTQPAIERDRQLLFPHAK